MLELVRSHVFDRWLAGLEDVQARARIAVRLDRLALGNAGDVRPIGSGLSELRIDYGPGYRIYFLRRAPTCVVLRGGGDKKSQATDIQRVRELAKDWRD